MSISGSRKNVFTQHKNKLKPLFIHDGSKAIACKFVFTAKAHTINMDIRLLDISCTRLRIPKIHSLLRIISQIVSLMCTTQCTDTSLDHSTCSLEITSQN